MMYILTIFRWSRVTICILFMTIASDGFADERLWMPRFGTVTTSQPTDIKIISQDIQLTDLEQVFIGNQTVWRFDVEAEFSLFNTSRIKKKPTILVPICTTTRPFQPGVSCAFKEINLKIAVDKRDTRYSTFARDGVVYARFPLKFSPRSGRKIVLSHVLMERAAGNPAAPLSRDYMIFDYHLEDSGAWDGPVGATYFSAKLPLRADAFNAKAFSNGEKFSYKNRLAYFSGRKLKLDADDGLSFYVTTSSYRHKVDRYRKRVKATPHSVKRRLALASALSVYPGAEKEMKQNIEKALQRRLKERSDAEIENASILFSNYLSAIGNFKSTKTPCDATVCIEKDNIANIVQDICSSDKCKESNSKALDACCAPPDSAASRNFDPTESIDELETDTDDQEEAIQVPIVEDPGPDIAGFILRYAFLLLMATLGVIGLTSYIIYRIKTRNQEPKYNKTLF